MKLLGIWTLIALVVGNMVGSGVFLLPSSLAQYGSISIFAWVFTSIGALMIALVFSRLSILSPKAGGPYVYCHEAFGGFTGFLIAYLYWIYSWVGNAAIATSMVSYLAYFYPTIATSSATSFILIAGIIWALTLVNALGVEKAGFVQLATVVLKLIPLILVSLLGIYFIQVNHFADFNVSNQSNFMALSGSATLTMWALTGVESATIPADHIQNPKRNIPLATIVGTVIAIALYILSTIVVMGIIPMSALATSTAPFAEAAQLTIGHFGGAVVAFAAIISSIGALNGWILLQGQVPHAASQNQAFPAFFGKTSRYNTPVNALVSSSVLITLLLVLNYNKGLVDKFTSIISLATISILFVYGMVMAAEIVLLIRKKQYQHFYRKISINILAIIYILWAFYGSDREMVVYCLFLALTGIPLYFYSQRQAPVVSGELVEANQ